MGDRYSPHGWYADADTAYHLDCADPADWEGFDGWPEPVYIGYFDESDSPTVCAGCGDLIGHDLTPDGYEYIVTMFEDHALLGQGDRDFLASLADRYGDNLEDDARARIGAAYLDGLGRVTQ